MTGQNETPEEHSDIVGGSTAARRINCPRSYALEQLVPKDKGSIYACEGTALHEMVAIVLTKNVEPDSLLPFTYSREAQNGEDAWAFTVDEDLWYDVGQPALDAFDAFIEEIEQETGGEFVMMIEKTCAMPGVDGAFGTSDIIWRCGGVSGVWDWKFGRTRVDAEENAQLSFYGRAAAASYPEMFGAETWGEIDKDREVILSIMQPKCGDRPSEWATTVGELEDFRLTLVSAVAEAQEADARCEKGSWCAFATCRAVCPLHVGQSLEFGKKMAAIQEQAAEENRNVLGIPEFAAMLPELLELAETAKVFAGVVFAQAHDYAEGGGTIEGWKLKAKRSAGRLFASTEEEVKKFMKNRGYRFDDYMPRKMLTVPQIEKLLKRDGRTLPEEMFEAKPSSGTTLTRDGDAAPEVGSTSERMAVLGNKLAVLTGGAIEE